MCGKLDQSIVRKWVFVKLECWGNCQGTESIRWHQPRGRLQQAHWWDVAISCCGRRGPPLLVLFLLYLSISLICIIIKHLCNLLSIFTPFPFFPSFCEIRSSWYRNPLIQRALCFPWSPCAPPVQANDSVPSWPGAASTQICGYWIQKWLFRQLVLLLKKEMFESAVEIVCIFLHTSPESCRICDEHDQPCHKPQPKQIENPCSITGHRSGFKSLKGLCHLHRALHACPGLKHVKHIKMH